MQWDNLGPTKPLNIHKFEVKEAEMLTLSISHHRNIIVSWLGEVLDRECQCDRSMVAAMDIVETAIALRFDSKIRIVLVKEA